MPRPPFWIPATGIILSIAGFGVALYLTIAHYLSAVTLACSDNGWINCDKVTTSSYSIIFGVPLPLLGLFFFVGMLLLQLPVAWRATTPWIYWGRIITCIAGVLMVFWLVYAELFQLDAICLYCTVIHILTIFLFGITVIGSSMLSSEHEHITRGIQG